ncbi:hypothetical protein ZWY2020_027179 [Hordeum vulgare]|nr:hypothetical protein ZWY2020_027179 [Hordeum vulgare]
MAAVLPPWPHPAAATQTCVRIGGDEPIRVELKWSARPCSVSVRLHSDLILAHGLRTIDGWYVVMATDPVVRALDHRAVVADGRPRRPPERRDLERAHPRDARRGAGDRRVRSRRRQLADSVSSPALTPHGIAMAIVSHFGEQIDRVVDMGGDVHLPGLWVTLLYSEPKALLLACKEAAAMTEAAGAPSPGGKRRRESSSSKPCAICLSDVDSRDEGAVTLPCSHAFHTGCIGTWFHRASTCPTCRLDIMECSSSVRSESTTEQSVLPRELKLSLTRQWRSNENVN